MTFETLWTLYLNSLIDHANTRLELMRVRRALSRNASETISTKTPRRGVSWSIDRDTLAKMTLEDVHNFDLRAELNATEPNATEPNATEPNATEPRAVMAYSRYETFEQTLENTISLRGKK